LWRIAGPRLFFEWSIMWPYPKIVAHRGGGTLAPENTLAALRCGLQHGFHAAEFDVMLAADGIAVLMHDDCLGRTVAGRGSVASVPAAQLAQADAGSWFGPQFAGEAVPLFEQALAFCRRQSIWMNIEIKPVPGFESATGRVVGAQAAAAFARAPAAEQRPLLASFSVEALLAAKASAPDLPRAYLVDAVEPDWQARLAQLGAVALHVNQQHLTPALAHQVKAAGYGLFCYTVNDPLRARQLLTWGVDAFCTDRLDVIGPAFA